MIWGSRLGGKASQGAIHAVDIDASPGGVRFGG